METVCQCAQASKLHILKPTVFDGTNKRVAGCF